MRWYRIQARNAQGRPYFFKFETLSHKFAEALAAEMLQGNLTIYRVAEVANEARS